VNQQARDRVHDQREREQDQRDLDERRYPSPPWNSFMITSPSGAGAMTL
jgi:hypothetical protein